MFFARIDPILDICLTNQFEAENEIAGGAQPMSRSNLGQLQFDPDVATSSK